MIRTILIFLTVAVSQVRYTSQQTNEEFDNDWVEYFSREDLDDWMLRRGLNELYGHDLVPEPKIISAALRACRKLNDHAMAVRLLEAVKVSITYVEVSSVHLHWLPQSANFGISDGN